jgi:hypothetical protein
MVTTQNKGESRMKTDKTTRENEAALVREWTRQARAKYRKEPSKVDWEAEFSALELIVTKTIYKQ